MSDLAVIEEEVQREGVSAVRAGAPENAVGGREHSTADLFSLLAIGEDLHLATDLESGLQAVAGRIAGLVPYDTMSILLLDERGRELRFAATVGLPEEVTSHWRFGLGQGIVGTVARTGRSLLVDDVASDQRYIDAGKQLATELAVPLVTRGRTVGVLDVGSRVRGAFTPRHQELLEGLAGLLASAIEGSRLFQATRDQARRLSLLQEVSRELSSILDRRRLLERVAELVHRLTDYDVFSVMLFNEERLELEVALTRFRDGLEAGDVHPVALGEGLCGTAGALRKPVRVPNVAVDPRYLGCSHGIEVRSEMVIPMVFKDRLVGVLDLESSSFDAFSAGDEEVLSTLGAALAIAIENARLYERVVASERHLEDDLATAREIQKQLLPNVTPLLPGLQIGVGYEPARQLGGDFYDVLPCGNGRAAFAVGDVAGKGTSAALYGALAVGMLREHALQSATCEPSRVLAQLNDKLHQLGIGNRFLALTFAVFDAAERTVTLASSGLPHPYLVSATGEVARVVVEGVPLGLLPERSYDQARLQLPPGASLVIATDGIDEAHGPDGEEFGRARLEAVLRRLAGQAPADTAAGLLADVRRFSGAEEAQDDRTVLVLKSI